MGPSKVIIKTMVERSRGYRERQRIGQSPKTPKTNSERCREYRARLKGLYETYIKSENTAKKPVKGNSQRCREYRERLKASRFINGTKPLLRLNDQLENVSGSKARKSNSERCRDYRARRKLKALMSSSEHIGTSNQSLQLSNQQDDFSESSTAQNCLETNETSLVDSGAYEDDLNEIYLRSKWKGLRDTFRSELKKDLILRSKRCAKTEPTWKHYKDLQFLKDQMHPKPPVWDLREKPADPLVLSLTPSTSRNETRRTGKEVETTGTSGDNMEDISFISVKEEINPFDEFNTIPDFVEESKRLARENGDFMSSGDDSNPLSETRTFEENHSPNPSNNHISRESLANPIEPSGQVDDNYHFLMSLLPHIQKISGERQMLLRMRIQELVYKEVYKKKIIKS